jgi:signal recognition particle GTPase
MSRARGGGGAATQAGIEYQNRVAAWMSVRILAELDAEPLWNLPADVNLKFLRCETDQPVDDLLIGTSKDGHAFVQVKHNLKWGTNTQSELGKTIDQFIRQFLSYRSETLVKRLWERPLDVNRDRLVLITNSGCSPKIREKLPSLLSKIRELPSSQEISDAGSNSKEAQEILETVVNLLTTIWQSIEGDEPTDDEKRQILNLIRIQILDVDADRNDELQAKDRLRTSILAQPEHANLAWTSLIQICANLAVNQSVADQAALQAQLLSKGISLKSIRSYQKDIEQLRQYSNATSRALSEFSEIRVGDETVKIHRPVTQALKNAAEKGSLLVIGEPGAGKSGAIYDFAQALQNENRDIVFLAVDRLEANTLNRLREDLDLDHSLDEVLRQWQGSETGWLVIDALDAARSGSSAKTLRELISATIKLSGRWRVVVSIRKFDLRYSPELQKLFRCESTVSSNYHDPEFVNIRHINVSKLSDEELAEIRSQSERLAHFIDRTDDKLRELLTVPFNLRLMADLIGGEIESESLTPIKTQIELLNCYWKERVLKFDDGLGDAREVLLRHTVEKMVEARSLRINRSEVLNNKNSETDSRLLKEVLSSHILVEWQTSENAGVEHSILTFAHHVLFDYAVSYLVLRGLPEITVALIAKDFDLVLAIRPSIVFYFQHLWFLNQNRQEFWEFVFCVLRSKTIPEIGKLIGPSVAADLIKNLDDCEPLLESLEATSALSKDNVTCPALSHLVGAILVDPSGYHLLVGPNSPPWCKLIERLSQSIDLSLFYAIRPLVRIICEQAEKLTPNQLQLAGLAARRFFDFAWQENLSRKNFNSFEVEAVCHTFASDIVDSARLLRQLLEPTAMQAYGYTSIFWLANQIKLLTSHDADLIKDIYQVAFNHQETDNSSTHFGGIIMPLTSSRQQDFSLALYCLSENYPQFLEMAPVKATHALITILEGYVKQRHPASLIIENQFDFNGLEAHIITDYSAIWDSPTNRYDEALKILDAFEQYLQKLSRDPNRINECQTLVNILVAENRLAILWRCLLKCGATSPETLGYEIRCLGWAVPILTAYDTTSLIGDFLQSIFSNLTHSDRKRVERAILSISDMDGLEEFSSHIRNRLLGCLPSKALVTLESKSILSELASRGGPPPNSPPMIPEFTKISFREQGYLSGLRVPVKEFSRCHLNSSPNKSDAENILTDLQALHQALKTAEIDGVHPKQSDYDAWGELAEACKCIIKVKTLNCQTGIGEFIKQVLLEASEHPEPVHNPENDKQFDGTPSWGSPAARIDAAQGLIQLASHLACVDQNLLDVIERLSADPVPAVRFQVAESVLSLYYNAPDLMWYIINRMCCEEASRGVLQGLLPSLSRLSSMHEERIAELTKTILDRVTDGDGSGVIRNNCIVIFTELHLLEGNSIANKVLLEIINQPAIFHDEAQYIVKHLREYLTIGSIQITETLQEQVRQKAFSLIRKILDSALRQFRKLEAKHQQNLPENWSEQERETISNLAQVADTIATEVYFASGAFDEKRSEVQGTTQSLQKLSAAALGNHSKERFFREASTIFDSLSNIGFPHISHYLLETLIFLVDVDPKAILLKVGKVVQSSKSGNYQSDFSGANLIVCFIERFLAEYRHVLREDENCRRVLVEILDTFVGWPSARRLTYRMEEIFR